MESINQLNEKICYISEQKLNLPKSKFLQLNKDKVLIQIKKELEEHKIIFFIGAGISKEDPSNLPLAYEFIKSLIRDICNTSTSGLNNFLNINETLFQNYIYILLPELILEFIYRRASENFHEIFYIFKSNKLNLYHENISKLAENKIIDSIITTNFDELIEIACKKIKYNVILKDQKIENNSFNIFKIHGSLGFTDSIISTLSEVGQGLSKEKKKILEDITFKKNILVMGWSNDDIDLSPELENIGSKIYWVKHIKDFNEDIKINDKIIEIVHLNNGVLILYNTKEFFKKVLNITTPKNNGNYSTESYYDFSKWAIKLKERQRIWIITEILTHIVQWEKALELFNKLSEIAEKKNDDLLLAKTFHDIALIYMNMSEWDDSKHFFLKSLEIYEQKKELLEIAKVRNNLGLIEVDLGNYDNAEKHYLESLKIKKQFGDDYWFSSTHGNLGLLYIYMEKFNDAEENLLKSLDISNEYGDLLTSSNQYCNLGILYSTIGQFEKAIKCYNESLKIGEKLGDNYGIVQTKINLAELYSKTGNLKSGMKIANECTNMVSEIGDPLLKAQVFSTEGNLMRKLKEYENSGKKLLETIKILEKFGSKDDLIKTYFEYFSMLLESKNYIQLKNNLTKNPEVNKLILENNIFENIREEIINVINN